MELKKGIQIIKQWKNIFDFKTFLTKFNFHIKALIQQPYLCPNSTLSTAFHIHQPYLKTKVDFKVNLKVKVKSTLSRVYSANVFKYGKSIKQSKIAQW